MELLIMNLKKPALIVAAVVVALLAVFFFIGTRNAPPAVKSTERPAAPTKTWSVATLAEVNGDVWIGRDGAYAIASMGDRLSPGDKVKTADGSAVLSIDDTATSRLEADTEIEITSLDSKDPAIKQLSGILWNTFTRNDETDSYSVEGENGTAQAVGTDFVTTPSAILTAIGEVKIGGTSVAADEKYDFLKQAKVALTADEKKYLAEGLDVSIKQLKKNRLRVVLDHEALFAAARAAVGINEAVPLADAFTLFFDGVDEGSLDLQPLTAVIDDTGVVARLKALTAAIRNKTEHLEKKGFAVGLAADLRAISPPPRTLVEKPRALAPEDRVLAALIALGIDNVSFAKNGGTFGVYYEQPAPASPDDLMATVVSVFTYLGVFEPENESYSVTPYGTGSDQPFLTFLASKNDVTDYLKGIVKLDDFLKKVRTKEDMNALTKPCAEAIKNSHKDTEGSGYCVCDDGYTADLNTQLGDMQCLKLDKQPPPLPPKPPESKPPTVVPPTPPTPPETPTQPPPPPPVETPSASATLKKGRTTIKSEQYPGTVEQFSFDNGVMSGSAHRYDFDFEFIYNDEFKNPALIMSDGEGRGWALSSAAFDAMSTAPTSKYCGYDLLPTTESDPCNYLALKAGQNYYLRTASGGMIKDSSGQTIALGGKIRYAKIHIVSVSPDAATFDWVFQTEENNHNLR